MTPKWHTSPSSLVGWDQALPGRKRHQNQSPLGLGCAAFPHQYEHLPNREIVVLVSKVMIIFAPFHLFDATAVSISACGVIPLCRWGTVEVQSCLDLLK